MNKNNFYKKVIALALVVTFIPSLVFATQIETPILPQNINGGNGIIVNSQSITTGSESQTLGLLVKNMTEGMNQINLAVTLDGTAASHGIGLRPGAAIKFDVPPDSNLELSIKASTNAQLQGRANIEIIHQPTSLYSFTPGTYVAQSVTGGFAGAGDLTISAVFSENRIESINVVEHHDTPNWFNRVDPWLINSVLLHQSTDVDIITSATESSNSLLSAIDHAIYLAGGTHVYPGYYDYNRQPQSNNSNNGQLPIATASFMPGTFISTVPSFQQNPLTLSVTFEENRIISAEVIEHGDSKYGSGWWFRAMPAVLDQIVVQQSTNDLDTFTGATITQNAIVEAFENTIRQAGEDPSNLFPQKIDKPLQGDLFIPGFVEITVLPNTLDIYGNPLSEGATRMLYSQYTPMVARFSFGRNKFHLHEGNALTHGESVLPVNNVGNIPDSIGGGTWGSWFFRQVVPQQINDRQTTQGIDIQTGATMSASGILWATNQAIMKSGATPDYLLGSKTQKIVRNPSWSDDMPFFVPGIYMITKQGFGGPMDIEVTLDRTLIRRIQILNHNETPSFFDMVWGGAADHVLRNAIFQGQWAGLDTVDVISGATVTSRAIIDAVREAGNQAWIQ